MVPLQVLRKTDVGTSVKYVLNQEPYESVFRLIVVTFTDQPHNVLAS